MIIRKRNRCNFQRTANVCFFSVLLVSGSNHALACGETTVVPEVDAQSTASLAVENISKLPIEWAVKSLSGDRERIFPNPTTKAVVFIFVSCDCPIANGYLPRLKQLDHEFRPRGVKFYLVHSSKSISNSTAKAHRAEYGLTIPILLDSDQTLARAVSAKVTPTAVVMLPTTRMPAYRGAIDNLYAGYGKKRPLATRHFMSDALTEILAGKTVSVANTTSIGCYISFDD